MNNLTKYSILPTNISIAQPVTLRDRLIAAVIPLLFKLGGGGCRIPYLGRILLHRDACLNMEYVWVICHVPLTGTISNKYLLLVTCYLLLGSAWKDHSTSNKTLKQQCFNLGPPSAMGAQP